MEEILLMGEKYWLTIGLAILTVLIFLFPKGRQPTRSYQREIKKRQEAPKNKRAENLHLQKESVQKSEEKSRISYPLKATVKEVIQNANPLRAEMEVEKANIFGERVSSEEKWSHQIVQFMTSFFTARENQLNYDYGNLKNRIVGRTVLSNSKTQMYLIGGVLFLGFTKSWALTLMILLGFLVFVILSIHWIDVYERGFAVRSFVVDQDCGYEELSEVCFVNYQYTKQNRQENYATFITHTGREFVEEANQYFDLTEKMGTIFQERGIRITRIDYQDGELRNI